MLFLYECRIGRGVFLTCLFAFFSPSPQSAFLYFPGGAYRARKPDKPTGNLTKDHKVRMPAG
jgi:hypothetical protein